MLSAALTRNSSMPSSRRWADITDDDDSEEVYVWDWEAFKREYLATHCRLTLMTPVCASVCLLATCDWAPRAAPLAPEAGAIVIDEDWKRQPHASVTKPVVPARPDASRRKKAKVPTPQKHPQPGVSSEEDEVLNAAFQRAEVQVP
ncbi:pfh1, partial [Symbiodinium necroappetens]